MLHRKLFVYIVLVLFSVNIQAASSTTKPTLVLVHGALLTSKAWSSVQSYLQTKGYNVVTLDVPGRADDEV